MRNCKSIQPSFNSRHRYRARVTRPLNGQERAEMEKGLVFVEGMTNGQRLAFMNGQEFVLIVTQVFVEWFTWTFGNLPVTIAPCSDNYVPDEVRHARA